MDIIKRKNIFLGISGVLVALSFLAFLMWGLALGIDFTGGSILEAVFKNGRPEISKIRSQMSALDIGNVSIQPSGEKNVILRFRHIDEPTHQKMLESLRFLGAKRGSEDPVELRFDTIGPVIGSELKRASLFAIALAIVAILLYVAWAFRQVSKPVSSWKYGVAAIIALVHDTVIPVGVFSALGKFHSVEIDSLFITALLTILGFSVHDTIVTFDRIRENLKKLKTFEPFDRVVNRSINETMSRSINTSLTVLLVILAIILFGGETTYYFACALIIGIFAGTYSSIFVASPLLVVWHNYTLPRKKSP